LERRILFSSFYFVYIRKPLGKSDKRISLSLPPFYTVVLLVGQEEEKAKRNERVLTTLYSTQRYPTNNTRTKIEFNPTSSGNLLSSRASFKPFTY